MFESWDSGVPFITTCVGERTLFLGETPAGPLRSPGNNDELTEVIVGVLGDNNLATTLRDRGFQSIKESYWDMLLKDPQLLGSQGSPSQLQK